jgi:hypothetical protein
VLANAALREYVRYENQVGASIERGLGDLDAGRTRTTDEVLARPIMRCVVPEGQRAGSRAGQTGGRGEGRKPSLSALSPSTR